MNNKVPLFQFQKIYYLLIVGMLSTVIFLLSAVPNPSYAQSGKRICMSADKRFVFKIAKGNGEKQACKNSVSANLVMANGSSILWGKGRYMTCEAFKNNYLKKGYQGNPCLKMAKTVKREGTFYAPYRPKKGQIYTFGSSRR